MIDNNRIMGENAVELPFNEREGLLFYKDRLVLPKDLHKEVFKLAHNRLGYVRYHRTYKRVVDKFYVHHLDKVLRVYLRYCDDCTRHTTPRHKKWGVLQLIITPLEPFHTVGINFVLGLPRTAEL